MPELPEVETVRRSLQTIIGAKIKTIEINRADIIRKSDYQPEVLGGKQITAIKRRGKFLILKIETELNLIVHMGMSGRFYMLNEDDLLTEKHIHIIIHLDNASKLIYQDARRFGGIWLIKNIDEFFSCMGVEPLSEQFNAGCLGEMVKNRKIAIKSLLLNQNLVCGIGNIYADEALFQAGIRPDRPAGSLTTQEIECLCLAIKDVLKTSIEQRGTTFRDYRDGFNRVGNFQNHLKVYGKVNEKCPVCGAILKRDKIGGRSSHYCEKCQK